MRKLRTPNLVGALAGLAVTAGFLIAFPPKPVSQLPVWTIKAVDKALAYSGPVTPEGVAELLKRFQSGKANQLFICSPGGSSEAGLDAAEFIVANNIAVTAFGQCHSSCANYFFLPSRQRRAVAGTPIGLHGGFQSSRVQQEALQQTLPPVALDAGRQSLAINEKQLQRERAVLQAAGIRPEIIVKSAEQTNYGTTSLQHTVDRKTEVYLQPVQTKTAFDVWFPSRERWDDWGIKVDEVTPQQVPAGLRACNLPTVQPKLSRAD